MSVDTAPANPEVRTSARQMTTPKATQNSADETPSGRTKATAKPLNTKPAPTPANSTPSKEPQPRARNCVIVQALPLMDNAADATPATRHSASHNVAVELQTGPPLELVAKVQAGELDAAIVADTVDSERFTQIPLYREALVLVGAADCSAIRDYKRLAGCTLLVFQSTACAYRRRFEQWLQTQHLVPSRILQFASYHAILAAAITGVGVSLVPRSVLDIYPQLDALTVRPMPVQMQHPDDIDHAAWPPLVLLDGIVRLSAPYNG